MTSTSPMNHLGVQSQSTVRQVADGRDGHLSKKQGGTKPQLGNPPGHTGLSEDL